jgi:hypothetical protein
MTFSMHGPANVTGSNLYLRSQTSARHMHCKRCGCQQGGQSPVSDIHVCPSRQKISHAVLPVSRKRHVKSGFAVNRLLFGGYDCTLCSRLMKIAKMRIDAITRGIMIATISIIVVAAVIIIIILVPASHSNAVRMTTAAHITHMTSPCDSKRLSKSLWKQRTAADQ